MDHEGLKLPEDIYYGHLETVNNIKFTLREIEVISFLVSGRSVKKIASFFNIAPKTVENHNRNIMQKLGCNSRESIVDFIEKSPKFPLIKKYYINLLIQNSFEQILKDISRSGHAESMCVVRYTPTKEHKDFQIKQLEKHLSLAGVKTRIEAHGDPVCFAHSTHSLNSNTIIILPKSQKDNLRINEVLSYITNSQTNQNTITIFTYDRVVTVNLLKELETIPDLDILDFQNYYNSIFLLLKKLLPNVEFDQIISKFKQQAGNLQFSNHSYSHHSGEEKLNNKKYIEKFLSFISFLNFNKKKLFLSRGFLNLGIIIGLICATVFIFKDNKEGKLTKKDDRNMNIIRSDLLIPTKATLLVRHDLLHAIQEKLKEKEGIQVVALVGIGGSGKTTLARQYANQYADHVVWEVNAETHESIINSLENLSYSLAKSAEDSLEFKEIQQTQDQKNKEMKLLTFVKKMLVKQPGWLLLYDNVESLSPIQEFVPLDPNAWGDGKIIITTRDGNIENHNQINPNYVIHVGPLSKIEKDTLFRKIFIPANIAVITHEQKQKILNCLEDIPPFPLDISIAAKYLKHTKMELDEFVGVLKSQEESQDNSLRIISGHEKTRHSIITMSLDLLLKKPLKFTDLLLFVSLIDSQNIPRDLLIKFKDQILTDQFLFHLKKQSLVIEQAAKINEPLPTFSIHRSTQEAIFTYLVKTLKLDKDKLKLKSIVTFLCEYMSSLAKDDDIPRMRSLANHVEKLIKQTNFLDETMIADLSCKLAYLYVYLGAYQKSQELYDKSLSIYQKTYGNNHIKTAWVKRGLGSVSRSVGEYKKAKVLLEEALAIIENHYGTNSVETHETMVRLGNLYRSLRDYRRSKEFLEKALVFSEKYNGKDLKNIAAILVYLGYTYKRLGEYNNALACLEKASSIYNKFYGEDNLYSAFPYIYLGSVYGKIGKYEQALKCLHQALTFYKEHYGNNHIETAIIRVNLGTLYQRLGNYTEALKFLKEGYAIYYNHLSNDHIDASWSGIHFGHVYNLIGDHKNAKALVEQHAYVYVTNYGKNHPSTAWALLHLANVYKNLNDLKKAKQLYKEVLVTYTYWFGKNHFDTAQVIRSLGEVSLLEGDLNNAEALLNEALQINKTTQNPEIFVTLESLAELNIKKAAEAIKSKNHNDAKHSRSLALNFLEQALKISEDQFSKNSPHVQRIQLKIRNLG